MRTLILGFDAFDPVVFERLVERGQIQHLTKYVESRGYARFSVSNPPQSEVSWTSISTGLNPGEHGIFDLVHRNPKFYSPSVSLLPTKSGVLGTQFVPPHNASTIFDHAVKQGFPATVMWWPATFPARPESPVQTLPGLGTPDIQGRLGVGTSFTSDDGLISEKRKTRTELLRKQGRDRWAGELEGPIRKTRSKNQKSGIQIELQLFDDNLARLRIGNKAIDLPLGQWSPILEVEFKMGLFYKIHALTRVILTEISPEIKIYFLPLQIHPLNSPWRYATPGHFVKQTWKDCGPFLTVGWPQDTTALEEDCINDQQFLDLCASIFKARERILLYHLQDFHEGVLAAVFDSLDRIQHMFWKDRQDIVETWYRKLDSLVGKVEEALASRDGKRTHMAVISDHGFANFDHKVHLNRWLIERGYLKPKNGAECGGLSDVDWSGSQAYALGLNSIYINLAGREGQGVVKVGEIETLTNALCNELQSWIGPDHMPVVQRAYPKGEVLHGSLATYGPDILVGFSPGYRASQQTGLGTWEKVSIEPNNDHWSADHCVDFQSVPGVLFSSKGLQNLPNPSYRDVPELVVGEKIISNGSSPPPAQSDEDAKVVEDRLKSLGYL
jgi:predicted AlkP superfamily phosphohydrolase/phosphomutase